MSWPVPLKDSEAIAGERLAFAPLCSAVVGKVFLQEVIEVRGFDDALPAASGDEPSSPCLARCSSKEKAQEVLKFLHDELPFEKSAPADDAVKVRRVGCDRVEAPTPAITDVGTSEHQDFLKFGCEDDFGMSCKGIILQRTFRVGSLITELFPGVPTLMRGRPGAVRMQGEMVHGHDWDNASKYC
jgi:hypothetical protein